MLSLPTLPDRNPMVVIHYVVPLFLSVPNMGAALFVEIRFCDRDPFARREPARELSSNDTSIIADSR